MPVLDLFCRLLELSGGKKEQIDLIATYISKTFLRGAEFSADTSRISALLEVKTKMVLSRDNLTSRHP